MKSLVIFVFVACMVAITLADGEACKKTCPKNFKRVSALKSDGSCVTYSNHCLLNYEINCQNQVFEKCYRGEGCAERDDTKIIACQHTKD